MMTIITTTTKIRIIFWNEIYTHTQHKIFYWLNRFQRNSVDYKFLYVYMSNNYIVCYYKMLSDSYTRRKYTSESFSSSRNQEKKIFFNVDKYNIMLVRTLCVWFLYYMVDEKAKKKIFFILFLKNFCTTYFSKDPLDKIHLVTKKTIIAQNQLLYDNQ